jgi:hypothetical protein
MNFIDETNYSEPICIKHEQEDTIAALKKVEIKTDRVDRPFTLSNYYQEDAELRRFAGGV